MDPSTPTFTLLHMLAALAIGIVIGRLTVKTGPRHANEARRQNQGEPQVSVRQAVSDLPPDVRARIERLIAQDRYIEAIRDFRAETRMELKDAKDAIDLIRGRPGSVR